MTLVGKLEYKPGERCYFCDTPLVHGTVTLLITTEDEVHCPKCNVHGYSDQGATEAFRNFLENIQTAVTEGTLYCSVGTTRWSESTASPVEDLRAMHKMIEDGVL